MKIALVGTRGIPARYGGFETFAEELSTRLAARGHAVTVYCRERHSESTYRGVNLTYLPTVRHKYLDTVFHTLVSTLHLTLRGDFDVALYCNAANAIFTWMPRVVGVPVALNVDGLERNRKKWNWAGRLWYQLGERLSTVCPNAVVSDAVRIREYYRERYGKESTFIPYGADPARLDTQATLDQLGLEPGEYFLYVSRMEPENNALLVREAFEQVTTAKKLALIGDAPYAHDYIARVRATTDPRVVLPGGIYGDGYRELTSHSFAYIHATEVGGTHPALIESMARGALTLYLDTPENEEVAGGAAIPFTHDNLAGQLKLVLDMTGEERAMWQERARQRVLERYSWDAVTTAYERLLRDLVG
jgi:glycosyltransferase involved in cell wall biosynthesis